MNDVAMFSPEQLRIAKPFDFNFREDSSNSIEFDLSSRENDEERGETERPMMPVSAAAAARISDCVSDGGPGMQMFSSPIVQLNAS